MKAVEHLKDRRRDMLFNRHACAEGPRSLRGVKNNRRQIAPRRALIQRRVDLAHHRDVENVQRWTAERNARDAILDLKFDVLEFRHPWTILLFRSSTWELSRS